MAPIPKNRSVSRGRTRSPRTAGEPGSSVTRVERSRDNRRGSVSRVRSRSSMSLGSSATSSGTSSVMSVSVRKRGRKVHKEGLKKKVKVSKKFRKVLNAALQPKGTFGTFTDISYSVMQPGDNDQQNWYELGYSWNNRTSFFSPSEVLNAASVLWNEKANVQSGASSAAGNFPEKTFKVEVLKQSVTLKFKNNTARDLTVNIVACSPRGKQYQDGFNALDYWNNCLIADWDGGSANRTAWTQSGATKAQLSRFNLYNMPMNSPKFRQNYESDLTTVVIEAGKEYNYTLKGPQRMYEFNKYWSALGAFDNQQKWIKQILVSVACDMTGTTLGAFGRYNDINQNAGFGLIYEMIQHKTLKLSEQAGVNFTVAPGVGTYPLNERKPVRFIQSWDTAQTGAVQEIDDENPAVVAQTGTT